MIYLRNATRKHRLKLRALERTARALLVAAGEPHASLSLSFVGDAAIRRLNREHRGKDKATDVLSFPLFDSQIQKGDPAPPTRKARGAPVSPKPREDVPERMLGDVVISVDTAWRQARAYDATLDAELERLMIHGILHLLGYDHEEARERARMEREERRLARAIGLPWPYLMLE